MQYGPGYRTLANAWVGGGSAAARLQSRSTHEGTQVHPADLDDALCVGALVASGDDETRLPFAVDDALLQGAPAELWAVRALQGPICHPAPVACLLTALAFGLDFAGSGTARGRGGRSTAWQSSGAAGASAA